MIGQKIAIVSNKPQTTRTKIVGVLTEGETQLVFTNDDFGIEIDEFDTDEFLELFCKAAKNLEVSGNFYDINDDEYSFISANGSSYYENSRNIKKFNDELDEVALDEGAMSDD